ncbi:MAG: hypothetical protein AAFV90_29905, partial [Cyanobacteria bacterium J06634_5]
YFTAGTLKAGRVTLVKPVAYLRYLVSAPNSTLTQHYSAEPVKQYAYRRLSAQVCTVWLSLKRNRLATLRCSL